MAGINVSISGLKEFRAALKSMENGQPKLIRVALNEGSTLVVDYARALVPVKTGHAKASIKVRSTQLTAAVAAGGKKAPYYPWLDFGGRVGKKRSVKRPYYSEGRYIYPGLKLHRDEIIDKMATALSELARESGLEVS